MRQRGDKDYAGILSVVRVVTISYCQREMLQPQLVATGRRATVSEIVAKYGGLSESELTPIVLMPSGRLTAVNQVPVQLDIILAKWTRAVNYQHCALMLAQTAYYQHQQQTAEHQHQMFTAQQQKTTQLLQLQQQYYAAKLHKIEEL